MDELRYLAVMADGVLVTDEHRIHIHGRSTMSLMPDMYTVDIYNLPPEGLAAIRHADSVSIVGKRSSILCSCKPADILHTTNGVQDITTLMMIDGEEFWRSTVALTIRGDTDYLTAIRTVLAHSTHPTPLATTPICHQKTIRGLTVYGRTARIIDAFARELKSRAYLFRDTVNFATLGSGTTETLITEGDIRGAPAFGDGVLSLSTDVIGMMLGRRITVNHDQADGIWRLVAHQVDADNKSGPWKSDLIMIAENGFAQGWEGGL